MWIALLDRRKHNQNPSFGWAGAVVGQDWSKDIHLAVTEWQLDCLENIWYICLHGGEAFLRDFQATRAGFLDLEN